jgi:CBS domain-containing protein
MATDLVTIGPDAGVLDAAKLMAERHLGGLPVVDDDGGLVGLIEEGDVIVEDADLPQQTYIEFLGAYIELPSQLKRFEHRFKQAVAATVADAMKSDPPTVSPGDSLEDVATYMLDHQVGRLAVTDEAGALVGIVTRGDLVRAIAGAG